MITPSFNHVYKKHGYTLDNDLSYVQDGIVRFVPKGFFVDGASIPSVMWKWISSPYDPRIVEDAIIHDWDYTVKYMKKADCDLALYTRMKRRGAFNWLQIQMVYRGLQVGGWIGWRDTDKDKEYLERLKIDMVSLDMPLGRYGIR